MERVEDLAQLMVDGGMIKPNMYRHALALLTFAYERGQQDKIKEIYNIQRKSICDEALNTMASRI